MTSTLSEIPLPTIGGFSIAIELGTPGPSPSPTPTVSASPSGSPGAHSRRTHAREIASPSPSPSPSPAATGSDSASPVSSASPAASGKPSAGPSGKPTAKPTPKPKIVVKTTIYPEDAPAAPSPEPSGDVQTFFKRQAIVRGFLEPASDVSLYGLGAIRFTIPEDEQVAGRGFTIAFFQAGKKHHEKLLGYDSSPTLTNDVVASSFATTALAMKKGQGYYAILYGDEEAAPAGAVPPGYPQPGVNPFVTPAPPGYPQGQPGQPGYPQQPGAPYPTQTPFGTYPDADTAALLAFDASSRAC